MYYIIPNLKIWYLTLYILTTGTTLDYGQPMTSSKQCLERREQVIKQLSPEIKKALDKGDAYLLCHPPGKVKK